MIIAGVIALCLLSALVCFMWVYVAIEAEKERKREMEKKFWFTELKQDQKCTVCGKIIKEGRLALVFKNVEAEHIKGLGRVRICSDCALSLEALLEKGKVL